MKSVRCHIECKNGVSTGLSALSCGFVLCVLLEYDLSPITLVTSNSVLYHLLLQNKFWWISANVKRGPEIPGFPGCESRSYKISIGEDLKSTALRKESFYYVSIEVQFWTTVWTTQVKHVKNVIRLNLQCNCFSVRNKNFLHWRKPWYRAIMMENNELYQSSVLLKTSECWNLEWLTKLRCFVSSDICEVQVRNFRCEIIHVNSP